MRLEDTQYTTFQTVCDCILSRAQIEKLVENKKSNELIGCYVKILETKENYCLAKVIAVEEGELVYCDYLKESTKSTDIRFRLEFSPAFYERNKHCVKNLKAAKDAFLYFEISNTPVTAEEFQKWDANNELLFIADELANLVRKTRALKDSLKNHTAPALLVPINQYPC